MAVGTAEPTSEWLKTNMHCFNNYKTILTGIINNRVCDFSFTHL